MVPERLLRLTIGPRFNPEPGGLRAQIRPAGGDAVRSVRKIRPDDRKRLGLVEHKHEECQNGVARAVADGPAFDDETVVRVEAHPRTSKNNTPKSPRNAPRPPKSG